MKVNNFTLSDDWINAIPIRYHLNQIVNISGLYFFANDNTLTCQHFFDFNINSQQHKNILCAIQDNMSIRFSYVNPSLSNDIRSWSKNENIDVDIIDEWMAPQLILDGNVTEHLINNKSSQTKKNYNRYTNNRDNYEFISSDIENVLQLWNDVLFIDVNSWKGQQQCDMKSLNREDLQYIFYLINNPDNASLKVVYKSGIPLGYSLMFRANSDSMWYAVKWGASEIGRQEQAGFYCLYNHLEELNENNSLNVDFWGRRSETYDRLKNKEIQRQHILLKVR